MKKILMVLMILVLMSVSVFAQGNSVKTTNMNDDNKLNIREQTNNSLSGNQNVERYMKLEVKGLNNALTKVNNSVARERIQRNMEKFTERHQFNYENLILDEDDLGRTQIKAQKKVKIFGLFNVNIEDSYTIDDEGKVVDSKIGFLSKWFNKEQVQLKGDLDA